MKIPKSSGNDLKVSWLIPVEQKAVYMVGHSFMPIFVQLDKSEQLKMLNQLLATSALVPQSPTVCQKSIFCYDQFG